MYEFGSMKVIFQWWFYIYVYVYIFKNIYSQILLNF